MKLMRYQHEFTMDFCPSEVAGVIVPAVLQRCRQDTYLLFLVYSHRLRTRLLIWQVREANACFGSFCGVQA